MSGLTDDEFRVLDELYFVISYSELQGMVAMPQALLHATLSGLLDRELIVQMRYLEELKDFEKLVYPDPLTFKQSSFVASRKGLLVHNSRS